MPSPLTPYSHTYEFMVKQTNLLKVMQTHYFQNHFLVRYLDNIPLFAYEVCATQITHQQVDICEAHNPYGGRLAVPSGHSCGKTKLIGILCVHHMLTAMKSITRIVAPKLEQITKLSFGEVVETISRISGYVTINNVKRPNPWGFLAKFFKITRTLIYIKDFQTSWYIEASVARKNNSNSMAGQHNWSYLLILDEACGIEDDNITVSLGGLTEEKNSCIAFSQHAIVNVLFHNFVTSLSVEHGGVWEVVRLSSVLSPLVSDKGLENMLATYTSDEIRVRVEGLYPLSSNGMLFTLEDTKLIYEFKAWEDKVTFTSQVFTTDIAYKGIRDSSAIVTARVAQIENELGIIQWFVIIDNIEVYNKDTKIRPTEVSKKAIMNQVKGIREANGYKFSQYMSAIDATAGGFEASLTLEDEARLSEEPIETFALEWGGTNSLTMKEQREYLNERAKGYIKLQQTMSEGRFIIKEERFRARVEREMGIVEMSRDAKFKYQIISKQDMKFSPDILDCFAQLFLLPYEDSSDLNASISLNPILQS